VRADADQRRAVFVRRQQPPEHVQDDQRPDGAGRGVRTGRGQGAGLRVRVPPVQVVHTTGGNVDDERLRAVAPARGGMRDVHGRTVPETADGVREGVRPRRVRELPAQVRGRDRTDEAGPVDRPPETVRRAAVLGVHA